ncbi:TIGR03618 family F420-dependent PPOX class oxidoreductase [Kribbella sp. NPDC050124]|uniref:TIGR03618 family F420-dependent PPOX class oxidoreductase n=1 Tax=Kribbella sp. NPDC050124 TaxID=3364114 RepID=UPI0037A5AC58
MTAGVNGVGKLTPLARELLVEPNFAVVSTVNADGTPQQSVVWARERDGEVEFSTVEGRAKHRNLLRNDVVSVLVIDRRNGYRYSEIRGRARFETHEASRLIEELSIDYTGDEWVEHQSRPRVIVIVTPTRIHDYEE